MLRQTCRLFFNASRQISTQAGSQLRTQFPIKLNRVVPPPMINPLIYTPITINRTPIEITPPPLTKPEITPPSNSSKPELTPPPTPNINLELARLIVIRRSKMNKHKLKKLRKKMHYKWKKVKERRYIRKEKAYLDEKMALIQDAMRFDAKTYVASIIKKAKEVPPDPRWTDPLMPASYREQEMAKEARKKRYDEIIGVYLNRNIVKKVK